MKIRCFDKVLLWTLSSVESRRPFFFLIGRVEFWWCLCIPWYPESANSKASGCNTKQLPLKIEKSCCLPLSTTTEKMVSVSRLITSWALIVWRFFSWVVGFLVFDRPFDRLLRNINHHGGCGFLQQRFAVRPLFDFGQHPCSTCINLIAIRLADAENRCQIDQGRIVAQVIKCH